MGMNSILRILRQSSAESEFGRVVLSLVLMKKASQSDSKVQSVKTVMSMYLASEKLPIQQPFNAFASNLIASPNIKVNTVPSGKRR